MCFFYFAWIVEAEREETHDLFLQNNENIQVTTLFYLFKMYVELAIGQTLDWDNPFHDIVICSFTEDCGSIWSSSEASRSWSAGYVEMCTFF